eukprot:TRINITY_DN584_c0_g1_i1.p1 TRINITY_DN584_c0_g1~~TRINITY_DN584_c0_g1_i1.p1  ORF type:complete len:459 (+),score=97.42 TRINITY_DN584_c0_g1_i1:80-1378(+)
MPQRGPPGARPRQQGGGPGAKGAAHAVRDTRLWSAVALQQHLAQAVLRGAPLPQPGEAPPRRQQRLTLAQKMGLAPAPPPPLSAADWEAVERESRRRGDSEQPCAICHEPFGVAPQCILSCSHVFHQQCVQAFERFQRSGRGGGFASCPICRRRDYEKHAHTGGLECHRQASATTIQRVWRGSRDRAKYYDMRIKANPAFRRERQLAAVKGISELELAAAAERERGIDAFFAELDAAREAAVAEHLPQGQWDHARKLLLERGVGDCAICLGPLLPPEMAPQQHSDPHSGALARESVLLSCSHAFHAPCLASFEEYERCAHASERRCPCCRSRYAATPLWHEGPLQHALGAAPPPPKAPGAGAAAQRRPPAAAAAPPRAPAPAPAGSGAAAARAAARGEAAAQHVPAASRAPANPGAPDARRKRPSVRFVAAQ